MKWFSAALLSMFMFMAVPAMACNLQNTNLPEDVKKELELKCLQAEKAAKDKASEVATASQVDQLSAYAGIATEVAKAVGLAAKELGIAANEFILTPAGIITMLFVVFKVFGKLLATIVVAGIVNMIVWRLIRKIWYVETDKTVEVTGWFGWGKKTVPVLERITYNKASEGQVFLTVVLGLIAFGSLALIPVLS